MKNKILFSLCLILTLCLCSCNDDISLSEDTTYMPIISPDDTVLPVADSGASFADNLMLMTEADGNRMLSPYSAKMCLALLANGAEGETKRQILNAIDIDDLEKYNEEVKSLLARYETYSTAMALETANSLWLNQSAFGSKSVTFLPEYRAKMQDFYSAEVREVTNDNSVEEVNKWSDEKTNGKIKEILSEEHRKFAAVLANAVYFKAAWENSFSENLTVEGDFTNKDGSISKTDFMHNTDSFDYCEKDGIKAVKLDYSRYGSDDGYIKDSEYDFSMYLILADDQFRIDEFLSSAEFVNSKVRLTVPKFELEYETSLTDILKALGMTYAFEGNAEFGAMLEEAVKVDDVLQKTYIKIDENGTEAAAVTAVLVKLTSAFIDERPIKDFTADKPFYFAIRDNTNGELLFVGRYETVK